MRVGFGYDVHKLVQDRKLILGGVEIPHEKGLLGHSDADVLIHAVVDALLGAAALGDIGMHFPDNNPSFLGISSIKFLEKTNDLLKEKGYTIENIDSTIVAQEPKLLKYMPEMISNMAEALKIDVGKVSVKATTSEGLGFEGRKEGISAYAAACITKIREGEED
ncbi:MAG: 2-C-methyl-D-erythritol 2,4-cyclodiphosphate synthase [Deltaproteobacteria bacterium]